MFRLDKSISKAQSFSDAEKDKIFAGDVPYIQRLREATYLIAKAYNFSPDNPPRLNKQVSSTRKHS